MSFGRQSTALVVHITEPTLQVLLWSNGVLTLLDTLPNQNESVTAFARLVGTHPGHPVIILTDLIDESFRHDTIIHVGGSDRAALIKRKLDFAFRGTPYRLGKVTGRMEEGRRDDRLLMSAINKPDAIDPWVKVLVTEERAVQALTSVAFLLRHYVDLEKLAGEEYLLVSNLEGNNSLRQSFFRKGNLLFSRLTTISSRSEVTLGSDLYLETLQVRQYLERIQFVPFEAPLRIQVFSGFDEAMLQLESKSSDVNRFEVINASARLLDLKVDLQGQPGGPSLYQLARVLAGARPENIYGQSTVTRFHELRTFAARTTWSAAAILILGLGLQVPMLQGVLDTRDQRAMLVNRTLPLRRQYEELSAHFPQAVASPAEMQLIVRTYDQLEPQTYDPGIGLNLAADALAISPGLVVTAISWSLEEAPFKPFVDAMGVLQSRPPPIPGISEADAILAAELGGRTQLKVVINGEAYSPTSFREAQDQVAAYVEALEANPGVSVFATRMPTNVRTDVDVSTTVTDGEVRAPFTLEVTIATQPGGAGGTTGARP